MIVRLNRSLADIPLSIAADLASVLRVAFSRLIMGRWDCSSVASGRPRITADDVVSSERNDPGIKCGRSFKDERLSIDEVAPDATFGNGWDGFLVTNKDSDP